MTGQELRSALLGEWHPARVRDADDLLVRMGLTWEHLALQFRKLTAAWPEDRLVEEAVCFAVYAITALVAADSAEYDRAHRTEAA